MKIRSYLPFLTLPCGLGWFALKAYDYMRGTLHVPHDGAGVWLFVVSMVVWSIIALWLIVSGVIGIQHPYIVTGRYSIKVFGNSLNKQLSDEILWSDIASFKEKTFFAIELLMKNGQTKSIQLNGLGPWSIERFIALIKAETGMTNANNPIQGDGLPRA